MSTPSTRGIRRRKATDRPSAKRSFELRAVGRQGRSSRSTTTIEGRAVDRTTLLNDQAHLGSVMRLSDRERVEGSASQPRDPDHPHGRPPMHHAVRGFDRSAVDVARSQASTRSIGPKFRRVIAPTARRSACEGCPAPTPRPRSTVSGPRRSPGPPDHAKHCWRRSIVEWSPSARTANRLTTSRLSQVDRRVRRAHPTRHR
jgi:hypothetical protein